MPTSLSDGRCFQSLRDVYSYIDAFNTDDFDTYVQYYHEHIFMNIKSLPYEKNLRGYLDWVKPLHQQYRERLVPKKIIMDQEGHYVVAEFHTEFTAKTAEANSENFAGKWGPISQETGPIVKMIVFYHLDAEGKITQLEAESNLLRAAA